MLKHVLSINGKTASADGVTWTVDPTALATATGEDLFEALFPVGPGRDWYDNLDGDAPLYIDADEALQDVAWESMCDEEDAVASTHGVALVVEGSEGHTLLSLGLSYQTALRFDDAFGCFDEARLMLEEAGDRPGELLALQCAGRALSAQGDEEGAESYLDDALEIAQELGDKAQEAETLNALAQVYLEQERWQEAEDTFDEALELFREAGARPGEAGVLNNIGMLRCELGQWDQAKASFEQALAVYEETGVDGAMVAVMCNMATVWQTTGDEAAAIETIRRAMALGLQVGPEGVLTATSHALQMGYDAAGERDWDLLSRLAESLHEVLGPVDEEEPDEDDIDDMTTVQHLAQVAAGLMFGVAQARGDQSHPIIAETAEQVALLDELTGDLLGLGEWLEAVCDQEDGGLRLI